MEEHHYLWCGYEFPDKLTEDDRCSVAFLIEEDAHTTHGAKFSPSKFFREDQSSVVICCDEMRCLEAIFRF